MFRCARCKKVTDPKAPAKRVVVETREREYRTRVNDSVVVSSGWEIVREANVCPACDSERVRVEIVDLKTGVKVPADVARLQLAAYSFARPL